MRRVEGNEGDSFGETPTGATGTVALPLSSAKDSGHHGSSVLSRVPASGVSLGIAGAALGHRGREGRQKEEPAHCGLRISDYGLGSVIRPHPGAARCHYLPQEKGTLRAATEDAVGETPTGATETATLPQLFGCQPVKKV